MKSLIIASLFCLTSCALKSIDTYRGFSVGAETESKFRADELTCEEEATRLGFDNGLSVPDQSIRSGAVNRCLEKRGWARKS